MLLRVHFFGRPRFSIDGAPYALAAPPKALILLAYLLLERSAAVQRDTLAFALWPDEDEGMARANLRRCLYRLQRGLPESDVPWLIAESETIRWNVQAPYWFDVAGFENACVCTDRLDGLPQIYTGDLLEGLYEEWIFPIRERLRSKYLNALDQLASAAWSRRDFQTAAHYVSLLLGADSGAKTRCVASCRYDTLWVTVAAH